MLQLINGQFYRNGEKVKAEFGNREMIELLRRREEMSKNSIEAQTDVEVEVTYYLLFECLCGKKNRLTDTEQEVSIDVDDIEDLDIAERFQGFHRVIKCSCGQEYELDEDSEDRVLLKPKKK